jgi:hypothetical protein
MQVVILGRTYSVTKEAKVTPRGMAYNMFTIKGPRATYFSMPFLHYPGRHFIMDSKGKIANVFVGVNLIEQADGSLRVC